MDFQKLDGDDPSNQALKVEYHVNSYPRIVFADSYGNELDEVRGGMSRDNFELKVRQMLARFEN